MYQVFLVRKQSEPEKNKIFAMKILKKVSNKYPKKYLQTIMDVPYIKLHCTAILYSFQLFINELLLIR